MLYRRSVSLLIVITFVFSSISFIPRAKASTSLSLEPNTLHVPFLDLENATVIVSVDLNFYDIHDLKNFTLIFTFNGDVLSYDTAHAGDWGYSGSRSTHPEYGVLTMSGELTDGQEISGSGTFFTFAFNVRGVGSSPIVLNHISLEDTSGSSIPFTVLHDTVTVEAMPLETWVNGEYAELLDQYDSLNSNYARLQIDYHSLNSTHIHLLSNYTQLQGTYASLNSTFSLLQEEYHELEGNYTQLTEDYASVASSYTELESEHAAMKGEFNNIRNLLYVLTATTILFIATTVYYRRERSSLVWK